LIKYYTVRNAASSELIVEKSRFIGHIREAGSKDEADRFFAGIRGTHRAATHNVPVVVIGAGMEFQWAGSDGEPQGTSGAPILRMLTSEGVTNTALMVTRYFGGVKLGTGGLARAYTATAKAALDAAGVVAVESGVAFRYEIGYAYMDKLKVVCERGGFALGDPVFADVVSVTITAREEDAARVISAVTGLTGGAGRLIRRADCEIRA
jgi:uncharacterized YigZ family protein